MYVDKSRHVCLFVCHGKDRRLYLKVLRAFCDDLLLFHSLRAFCPAPLEILVQITNHDDPGVKRK